MNIFQEAKQILDKDGKVNALGPHGKGKLTGREISTYFRRNKVKDKQIKKAVEVALDMSGAMTVAYKEISKFYGKKVADSKEVTTALQYANEETIGDLGKASALDGGDQSADKGLTNEANLQEEMIQDFEIRFDKESDWRKAEKLVMAYLKKDVPKHAKSLLTKTSVIGPDPMMVAVGDTKQKLKPPVNLNKLYNSIRKLKSSRDKYWISIPKKQEKDALGESMTSSQKKQFDALYKKMDGGKEHMAIKKKIKNQVKADDAFHSLVMKKVMGEEIQVIPFFDTFRNMQTEGKVSDSIIRKDFPNVWAASAKDRNILKKFHTKVDTSNYKKQKQIYNKNKKAFMSGLGKEKLSSIMKKMTVKKGPMKGWMTDEVIRILHQGQQYVQETSLEEFNLNMPEKVRVQLLTLYNKAMDVPYGSPTFKGIKKQIDKINNKYAAKNEVAEKKVNWLLQKKAGEKGAGVAAYDKGKMVGYYPDMKTAKKFAPGLKYVQESEVTRAKEIADLKDKHKREIEKEKEDVKAIQKDEQLVGKEAIPFFDTYRNMHQNEAHKKYGVSSGEWQKHMGTERGVKKRVERKVRASGKKQIRKQLRRNETKPVIPFFDTFRNMQEEVMDITVDPKNKLPKTDQQNKIAQKIYNLAKTYNCKVAMVGKHLRFKGTKGDMNAIGRAVIGKSSMGNATGSDMSTPQIDKMLNKNLK